MRLVPILYFFSGLTALLFEVLCVKQLGFLFGNSTLASSVVLSIWFVGLAFGGLYWGKKANGSLLLYAKLEWGVGIGVVLFMGLKTLFFNSYEDIFEAFSFSHIASLLIKACMAGILLFPATFLMGGTFPAIGAWSQTQNGSARVNVEKLYALNILGAVFGAFLAVFVFPQYFGLNVSLWICVGLIWMISILAFMNRGSMDSSSIQTQMSDVEVEPIQYTIQILGFVSGFLCLALEVLWIRMMSLISSNSTYSFSSTLICFLLGIALGSTMVSRLNRQHFNSKKVLSHILFITGFMVLLSPFLFYFYTALEFIPPTFISEPLAIFKTSLATTLIPCVLLGMIFPFLLRMMDTGAVGSNLGKLSFLNSMGAWTGSLLASFVLIPWFGLWQSMMICALGYLLAAVYLAPNQRVIKMIGVSIFVGFAAYASKILPTIHLSDFASPKILRNDEGPLGIVSVIQTEAQTSPIPLKADLLIRLNNNYTLGGLGSESSEKRQVQLPFMFHPHAKDLFVLGMGTGISSGAGLQFPIQSLTVAEINAEVISAARDFFAPYNQPLFTDPRTKIVLDDGRNYLQGHRSQFDLITSDLFRPWGAGEGSLYSLEHFKAVKKRLKPDGIFTLWLPMHQLRYADFATIAKTICQVFPNVTMWRGNFSSNKAIVAMVAQLEPRKMTLHLNSFYDAFRTDEALIYFLTDVKSTQHVTHDPSAIEAMRKILPQLKEAIPYTFYIANISKVNDLGLFSQYPINTDEHPVMEYFSDKLGTEKLQNDMLLHLFKQISDLVPLAQDPFLISLHEKQHSWIDSGQIYFQSFVDRFEGTLHQNPMQLNKAQIGFETYMDRLGISKLNKQGGN